MFGRGKNTIIKRQNLVELNDACRDCCGAMAVLDELTRRVVANTVEITDGIVPEKCQLQANCDGTFIPRDDGSGCKDCNLHAVVATYGDDGTLLQRVVMIPGVQPETTFPDAGREI